MTLIPLTLTSVNWQEYISACKSNLVDSPTRILDTLGIKVSDPVAFLASLSMENLDNMHPNPTWQHVHLGYMVVDDRNEIRVEELPIVRLAITKKSNVILISGDMLMWYWNILHNCSEKVSYLPRNLFNKVHSHLVSRDVNLWKDKTRKTLNDGTYILV